MVQCRTSQPKGLNGGECRAHQAVNSLLPPLFCPSCSVGTRGESLIYHPIHPNSLPDVLWPLATCTHTHAFITRVHWSFPLSGYQPFFGFTRNKKNGSLLQHYFCQAVQVIWSLINLHMHWHQSETRAYDLRILKIEQLASMHL